MLRFSIDAQCNLKQKFWLVLKFWKGETFSYIWVGVIFTDPKTMTMKLFILILIFCVSSCSDSSNNQPSLPTAPNYVDTLSLNKTDTLVKLSPANDPVKQITISENYKAFNDIYFTVKRANDYEKTFKTTQELANLDFKVNNENYDETYGLYEFSLVSEQLTDINLVQRKLEDVFEIVAKSANESKELDKNCSYCIHTNCVVYLPISGEVLNPLPNDNGVSFFKKAYFLEGKTVEIGYSICYEYGIRKEMVNIITPNGSYPVSKEAGIDDNKIIKHYSIFLLFTCDEISSKIAAKRNNNQKLNNNTDAQKF